MPTNPYVAMNRTVAIELRDTNMVDFTQLHVLLMEDGEIKHRFMYDVIKEQALELPYDICTWIRFGWLPQSPSVGIERQPNDYQETPNPFNGEPQCPARVKPFANGDMTIRCALKDGHEGAHRTGSGTVFTDGVKSIFKGNIDDASEQQD